MESFLIAVNAVIPFVIYVFFGYFVKRAHVVIESGEEWEVLAFDCPILKHYFWFKDEEIESVELLEADNG